MPLARRWFPGPATGRAHPLRSPRPTAVAVLAFRWQRCYKPLPKIPTLRSPPSPRKHRLGGLKSLNCVLNYNCPKMPLLNYFSGAGLRPKKTREDAESLGKTGLRRAFWGVGRESATCAFRFSKPPPSATRPSLQQVDWQRLTHALCCFGQPFAPAFCPCRCEERVRCR